MGVPKMIQNELCLIVKLCKTIGGTPKFNKHPYEDLKGLNYIMESGNGNTHMCTIISKGKFWIVSLIIIWNRYII